MYLLRGGSPAYVYAHSTRDVGLPGNGAVLVMAGTVQQGWMHSIPKRKLQQGGRVSLTFRNVVNPER